MRVFSWCALAVLVGLGGCGRRETAVERGDREQVLHFGNKDEPADLDPHINNADSTGTLLSSLFEGLVGLAGDGRTILPGMADRWEVSPDGRVYEFKLRDAVKFHDGSALTARDVKASLDHVVFPPAGVTSPRKAVYAQVEAIEAPTARTVRGAKERSHEGHRVSDRLGSRLRLGHRLAYCRARICA